MTISVHLLVVILLCGVVTWLTRVTPFVLITKIQLSEKVVKWLSFIPITLFTALIIDGVITQHDNAFGYTLNLPFIITMIPTIFIAVITRSLTFTILGGILIIAVLRWLF